MTPRTPHLLTVAVAAQLAFEDACRAARRSTEVTVHGYGADEAHAAFVDFTRSAGVSPRCAGLLNDTIRESCRQQVRDGVLLARAQRVAAQRARGPSLLQVGLAADSIDGRHYVVCLPGDPPRVISLREMVEAAEQPAPRLGAIYATALRDCLALG